MVSKWGGKRGAFKLVLPKPVRTRMLGVVGGEEGRLSLIHI